ncbi:MAG TPA: sigma-70 family RNA polymerase sigma factor [Mycobacterium sp.]|nr:sigma-70 family RNA polymerase sigma factor [Mycobacterium sp.]
MSRDEVVEASLAGRAYSALSLDKPLDDKTGGDPVPLVATVGALDSNFALIEDRQCVRPLIEALSPCVRAVLVMRFFESLTQSQIATRIGVSQMHISRLLAQALAQLRDRVTDG